MTKKKGGANLPSVRKPEAQSQQLSIEQVLAHPVVKQMSQKLEEMRALVEGLPEAVGRAVAAHQASMRPRQPLAGPVVPLKTVNDGVEFHRKGLIVQGGEIIAKEGLMDRPAIPPGGLAAPILRTHGGRKS